MKIREKSKIITEDHHLSLESVNSMVEMLPRELLRQIFLYLSELELQSAVAVNRYWNCAALDFARNKKNLIITKFTKFLSRNLKREDYKILDGLLGIQTDECILRSTSLLMIKSSAYLVKKNLINLLKDLKIKNLNSLEKKYNKKIDSDFLKDIFVLTEIHQKLDEIHQISDCSLKDDALIDFSYEIFLRGESNKAIEIAYAVSSNKRRSKTLLDICFQLTCGEKIDIIRKIVDTVLCDLKNI